jgi:hypothetical protein
MSRADYAHWNEDADMVWWQEEGRHVEEAPEYDPYEDEGFYDEQEADEDEAEYVGAYQPREDFGWAGMTE